MVALRFYWLLVAVTLPLVVTAVTPMEKVITLIEDLKSTVEGEGKAEASVYDEFACFCKDTTDGKSQSIIGGQDEIERLSGTIGAKTAERAATETELQKRKAKQEELAVELKDEQVLCAKTKAVYEAQNADLTKAISGLNGAIGALTAAKPASLLSIRASVESTLALADVLDLIEAPKRTAVNAFLQAGVDPDDPSYKYHSSGILDTINKLLKDFEDTKKEADEEWEKTNGACKQKQASLAAEMESNADSISGAETKISDLKGDIAQAREELVSAEGLLKDDQLYLKDLTKRCEDRARDWDQRSQLRANELTALTEALAVLKDKAQPKDEVANKRALLLARKVTSGSTATPSRAALSFFQDSARGRARGLRVHDRAALSLQMRQESVASLLRNEGVRLGSATLSSLALRVASDPFGKVKQLIQDLVERLLAEATAEATKKGFCDTELGKAHKNRDFRLQDIQKINVELAQLEVKQDELEEEISTLTDALAQLNADLQTAEENRKAEKTTNMQTLKDAKDGLGAITEAIAILKVFYKQAAKATVLLQASPVDEDTSGAGFSGAYKGNQQQSVGIIGLLEVIKSDFERTLRTTEASEKKSSASFVLFDRVSRSDIGGKETKIKLDEEDLETTKNSIQQGMADMQSNQNLLDAALKTIEDLKPTCIDTTMTYDERVAKREEELAALNRALCILDTDKVEADCQQ